KQIALDVPRPPFPPFRVIVFERGRRRSRSAQRIAPTVPRELLAALEQPGPNRQRGRSLLRICCNAVPCPPRSRRTWARIHRTAEAHQNWELIEFRSTMLRRGRDTHATCRGWTMLGAVPCEMRGLEARHRFRELKSICRSSL